MSARLTQKEFEATLPRTVKCLTPYVGRSKKCDFQCTICGSVWTTVAHLAANGCRSCNIKARGKQLAQYTQAAFDKSLPINVRRMSPYIALNSLCTFKCRTCKTQWTTKAQRGLRKGCPTCNKMVQTQSSRKTDAQFRKELAALDANIAVLDAYVNSHTRLSFQHRLCGNIWPALPSNILKGRGCPKCKLRMKSVRLGNKDVLVRGYEDRAIEYMLTLFKPKQINVHNEKQVPNIAYTFRGSNRTYFPDMYVPHINTLVEVKSTSTIGLLGNWFNAKPSELFYNTRAKARAVIAEGYKFKLLIMTEHNEPLCIPVNWHSLSFKQFKEALSGTTITGKPVRI